jgi:hypothetical protein
MCRLGGMERRICGLSSNKRCIKWWLKSPEINWGWNVQTENARSHELCRFVPGVKTMTWQGPTE